MTCGVIMPPEHCLNLPQSVKEIAEVIGEQKALAFIGQLPTSGTRSWRKCTYIPKQLTADHVLVRQLGWHDAARMVDAFAGMILQPSNLNYVYRQYRNREIMRMSAEGMPVTDIADIVELSTYRVREIINLNQPKQLEVFND